MAPHHIMPNIIEGAFSCIGCGSAYRTVVADSTQELATCEEIVALPNGAA
jgi:hypothetical protein